ncbi:MAG: ABC transporter substrate-binding protein [Acetobacteraceae bacterium]|nr:ABC transporter substrate-binding protein [Acetobacteraceae bacterium]
MRRRDLLKAASVLSTAHLAAPALAQAKKPLRFIPQANLTALDPIWTTAAITYNHAYMIYDKLYGWDGNQIQPQMVAGHNVSPDRLTWTFALRDGLMFHDNEPVRSRDCAMSIRRWGSRDAFGQVIMKYVHEIVPLDDKRFVIHLKRPCPQLLFGFGARQCFIMPERDAARPGTEQVTSAIGSGPFRFLRDEWVSGVRAAYARFEHYVPRQEPPRFFAGGKVAHFDRVEWIVQPDPATAAAALQKNEADWIESPLVDLLSMLKKTPGVYTKIIEPGGWAMFMQVNHLNPPFDNLKVRQAILAALDQQIFADVAVGDQAELAVVPAGLFAPTMPMSNTAGMDLIAPPRDIARARKMVAESGYGGEPIVLMSPSDQPMQSQLSEVARDLFQSIGLKVDYQVMDWGSLVTRRASQKPLNQGGWGAFISVISPLTGANPGSMPPLHGVGRKGWLGWPTDERMEELRAAWFDAPDLGSQRKLAEQIQLHFLETVPFYILCRVRTPMALRTDIQDVVSASFPMFWGVRRV